MNGDDSEDEKKTREVAMMATWPKTAAKGMMEEITRVENIIVEGSKVFKEEEIDSTRAMAEEDMVKEMKGSMILTELIGSIEAEGSKASATTAANQDTWLSIADPNPRTTIEETKLMKEK
jgi:hypothetical protein